VPGGPVQRLRLPRTHPLATEARPDLGGIVAVTADAAWVDDADWRDTLYRPGPPVHLPTRLVAVPYYFWNSRGRARCRCGSRRSDGGLQSPA
jgi:DUF1680 family protein